MSENDKKSIVKKFNRSIYFCLTLAVANIVVAFLIDPGFFGVLLLCLGLWNLYKYFYLKEILSILEPLDYQSFSKYLVKISERLQDGKQYDDLLNEARSYYERNNKV